jgi:hypothetical protein
MRLNSVGCMLACFGCLSLCLCLFVFVQTAERETYTTTPVFCSLTRPQFRPIARRLQSSVFPVACVRACASVCELCVCFVLVLRVMLRMCLCMRHKHSTLYLVHDFHANSAE